LKILAGGINSISTDLAVKNINYKLFYRNKKEKADEKQTAFLTGVAPPGADSYRHEPGIIEYLNRMNFGNKKKADEKQTAFL
jgi:hypothetical protein